MSETCKKRGEEKEGKGKGTINSNPNWLLCRLVPPTDEDAAVLSPLLS